MSKIIFIILAIVGILAISNAFTYNQIVKLEEQTEEYKSKNIELENKLNSFVSHVEYPKENLQPVQSNLESISETRDLDKIDYSEQSITAVAVRPVFIRDSFFEKTRYEGTTMNIVLSIRDGKGLILVNTEIPTGVDFQTSAKTAVKVAEEFLNVDLSNKDVIFSITTDNKENLRSVDGQSAGVAMTVLLISELQGKMIDEDVVMTGAIHPDGTVGKVGGIFEKAQAAGKHGAKLFLIPNQQAITHIESCEESRTGNFIYRTCALEEKPLSPITEEMFGMKTAEVKNIHEAMSFIK